MTITLCRTSNDKYDVTKQTETVKTLSDVSIVEPCDILRPVFKVKGGYVNANYITGAFGRKYWITGQTINSGINYISCSVDAYSSFPDVIYGHEQYVTRSEKYRSPDMTDTAVPMSAPTEITMYAGQKVIGTDFTYVIGVI